jgi:hypothetical protein
VKNSGGSTGSSGSSSSSSGSGGMGGMGGSVVEPPPHPMVNNCDGLAAPGVFEEVTPPEVKAGIGKEVSPGWAKGGTFAMAVDPINQGTVYAGSRFQGLWKSTDCGSTWKKTQGAHATEVNVGMNWTLVVDPQEPNVVYTNSGYGSNGLFRSDDGGDNWTDIWSLASQPVLGKSFQYNFANVVAIDPSNHRHLLLTFHETCLPPHPATCIAESTDAGKSWTLLDGVPSWNGGEGQVIWFLGNSTTWLWGSQTNGFWRSEDSGKNWERIAGMETSHMQGSQILQAKNGTFYAAAADGVWRSPDGKTKTWQVVPNTGPILGGLVTDGTTMYASTAYFTGFGPSKYLRSAETDGETWGVMPSPTLDMGGSLGYDPGHKLLYSSNLDSGMWRVVVQ